MDVRAGSDPEGVQADDGPVPQEARAIVDAARAAGLTARLIGGLAALEHCRDGAACRHEHRDIDLVAPRREIKGLTGVLEGFGYGENPHVRLASAGQTAQFYRACSHTDRFGALHVDDRIDVYLDSFHLHHEFRLVGRLRLHPYAVSASDALLVKLQRGWLSATDLRDAIGILERVSLGAAGDQLDAGYIARLCGRDWGLGHDVRRALDEVRAAAPPLCEGDQLSHVLAILDALELAVSRERKTLRWRLRAMAGERLPWQDVVDEREGLRVGVREGPAA